ncbi:MAG: hypothetical protein LAT56_12275 [Wenzhouxiangella sp.]|nr:hypothetical protein [Wenzhouxiangella sp.]
MRVDVVGFKILPFSGVEIGEVFQSLENKTDTEMSLQIGTVVPYFTVVEGWIVGQLIRFRSNKKSIVSKRDENGDLLVDKQELASDEHGTEVTIMALNPSTLRGVFYSYRGAVTPNGLKRIFQYSFSEIRRQKIKELRNQLTQFGDKKVVAIDKRIQASFPYDFDLKLLSTPRDVDQVLKHFQEISSVHVNSEDALSKAGFFSPLEAYSKRAKFEF